MKILKIIYPIFQSIKQRINKRPLSKLFLLFLIFGCASFLAADGFIVIPHHHHPPHPPGPLPPPPGPFPLEVKFHKVDVKIEDQVAVTAIDQVFYNPTAWRLEGYYLFPIPQNAAIKKFTMFVDGKELAAELLDAKKARDIYEDIVRRQRDPALLEYSDTGVFKVRIFPIEPHSEKRVKLSYSEILQKDNQTIEYLYPLNTEKFSAALLSEVAVNVEIKSLEKIKNIYCPTHKTEISRKGDYNARIGYEEKNVRPNIDFKLYYNTDNSKMGFSLLSYKKEGEDGFFFLSISPGFETKESDIAAKDITFVLDVSGSMAGEKLDQAKKALLFCCENLNKDDRFEIVRFSTEAEALFGDLQPFNNSSRDKAREFIRNLKAIGGTNIDEALTLALGMKKMKDRPYTIIFITDGKPTIGVTDEDALLNKIKKSNIADTRIFTFGIGNEINTHLLDKITEITRAYRSYIAPEEDIEIKVSDFYAKVQSPILTDLELNFGSNIRISKSYPADLPDLFKGSAITLLGRYRGQGTAQIVLSGKSGNRQQRREFSGSFTAQDEGNDFIPPLWAARRIGYLLDQIRLHGQDKELVDEVTQLARAYGILTPYTSYLIVEDEKTNVRREMIRPEDQTLGQIAETDADFETRNKEEFAKITEKSGGRGVQVSSEVQQMNDAANYAQGQPGKSRLRFTDKKGKLQDMTQQVVNIQGRAVYNTGKYWVDSRVQIQKNRKVNRIQFAGRDYFDLLKKEPQAAQFLALGRNIRFVLNNRIYE
ncbi:MAG: VWA domain-containing protein, partial [Candidatus Aminicenantes bacterium]|nr:VWA domain-containing protein [Candidatus Aminicenantes bacterium]